MSIGASGACCLNVQQALDSIAGDNVTTFRQERPGALEAIRSPVNTAMGQTEQLNIQDPGGKTLTNQVSYWQNPRTTSATSAPTICASGSTVGQKFADVSTTITRSAKLTLDEAEFRTFCGDGVKNSRFAQQQVKAATDQLLVDIDQDVINFLSTGYGQFANGVVGPINLPLISPTYAPQYGGEVTMMNALEDAEVPGRPIVVGQGYLRDYVRLKGIACCNDQGVDLGQVGDTFYYYRDARLDQTMAGSNNIIAWQPGACQLVSRTTFVGEYQRLFDPDKIKTTVTIRLGEIDLPVDFTLYYDYCGDDYGVSEYVFTWTARFGFFNLPTDLEPVGSPFRSVNNIFYFTASCGTTTCSDVDS